MFNHMRGHYKIICLFHRVNITYHVIDEWTKCFDILMISILNIQGRYFKSMPEHWAGVGRCQQVGSVPRATANIKKCMV